MLKKVAATAKYFFFLFDISCDHKILQQHVCFIEKKQKLKSLKTRARICAPGVVFGNHAGDSLPSAMFGVQRRAHARAGCTKIAALLRILGGFGWSWLPGEEIVMCSLTVSQIRTCTHIHTHTQTQKEKTKGHAIEGERKGKDRKT